MKNFKIYTCGRMHGIPYAKQMIWRKELQFAIECRTKQNVTFIHPPEFYGYHEKLHKSEQEVMNWEMQQICDSDIVVVNLDEIESSVGSHMELGVACGANLSSGKHINIVSFGNEENIHPWLSLCSLRHEDNVNDLADYIATYLLI